MKSLRLLLPPLVVIPLTVVVLIPILVAALIKLAVPSVHFRRAYRRSVTRIGELWVAVTDTLFSFSYDTRYEITGTFDVNRSHSYLLIANHRSWVDVPVILHVFRNRLPFYRFFLKRGLIWLPLIGVACWALEYPFLKLHSRRDLEKHPHRRGEDLATARSACQRFRELPTTIVNFPEGRIFTNEAHRRQEPPYRHLLRPRAGGTSLVLSAMGDQLDSLLDMTIDYPDGVPKLWHFLLNRVPRIRVHVQQRAIPRKLTEGDYQSDPQFRRQFQNWINDLWHEKDAVIEQMKSGTPP